MNKFEFTLGKVLHYKIFVDSRFGVQSNQEKQKNHVSTGVIDGAVGPSTDRISKLNIAVCGGTYVKKIMILLKNLEKL